MSTSANTKSKRKKSSSGRIKRALKQREPKLVENTKKMLFMRGTKASQDIQDVLKDLFMLKKPHAKNFTKKNEIRPFENHEALEFLSEKNDASLFGFASHSKKRPNNLVLGRMFDHQLLDMVEFGVSNYVRSKEFKSSIGIAQKPMFVFKGAVFDNDPKFKEIKSLLLDTFRGEIFDKISLDGLSWILSVTASEDGSMLYFRPYKVHLLKSGTKLPRVELTSVGPFLDLSIRRTHFAAPEVKKQSLKKPKGLKPKKIKNISRNVFGEKMGRVHMKSQNMDNLQTRKMKALKKRNIPRDEEGGEEEGSPSKRQRVA